MKWTVRRHTILKDMMPFPTLALIRIKRKKYANVFQLINSESNGSLTPQQIVSELELQELIIATESYPRSTR